MACAECPGGRIVEGVPVGLADYPWVAKLSRDGRYVCGGVLIQPGTVLTAAHCVMQGAAQNVASVAAAQSFTVVTGPAGEARAVMRIEVEPAFRGVVEDGGDVALLWLGRPVTFPGELPVPATLEQAAALLEAGQCARLLGWGSNRRRQPAEPPDTDFVPTLRTALLPLQPRAQCESLNRGLARDQLCAGDGKEGVAPCTGDSGGPLLVFQDNQWLLIGLVSWGKGCAAPGQYGVYTDVSRHAAWIAGRLR